MGGGVEVLGSIGSPAITFNYCSAQSLNKNNLVSVKLKNCSGTQVVCFRDQILLSFDLDPFCDGHIRLHILNAF